MVCKLSDRTCLSTNPWWLQSDGYSTVINFTRVSPVFATQPPSVADITSNAQISYEEFYEDANDAHPTRKSQV